jgi:hypothetical protein
VLHGKESIFVIEYLREYEFIFETALPHESGGPGVLIYEKIEGRKSRDTVPLNIYENGLKIKNNHDPAIFELPFDLNKKKLSILVELPF